MNDKQTVMVPMSDGVKLSTDLYLPQAKGDQAWPVVMIRSPYNKNLMALNTEALLADGYAIVVQDTRGRYESEGEFQPLENERKDGVDMCAWLCEQPWCNGKITGFSGSYVGATQWLPALDSPPGLVTASPRITTTPFSGFGFYSRGVVQPDIFILWNGFNADSNNARAGIEYSAEQHPELAALRKASEQLMGAMIAMVSDDGSNPDQSAQLSQQLADIQADINQKTLAYLALPLSEQVAQLEPYAPWIRRWLDNLEDPDAEFWQDFDWSHHYEKITIPMLHQGGWHDIFVRGQLKDYAALTRRDNVPLQKIVIGPASHNSGMEPGDTITMGERVFPEKIINDRYDLCRAPEHQKGELQVRWFERFLKGVDNGIDKEAPVTLYVQGENVWRDEWEWPLARTQYTPLYLHSRGSANSIKGDGSLNFALPAPDDPMDQFSYDPANPVPSAGGTFLNLGIAPGIYQQTDVEQRDDVLVYTTEVLERDMEVTGPVIMKLWVSTSAVDTDFTARLADVEPGGRSDGICDGITRLRFRKEKPGLVTPGAIEELEIELTPTSYVFKAGHRVRIQISSSNYPLCEINSNTGKSLYLDNTNEMIVAQQKVFHDERRPSHMLLPVIPK